jgi:radical SAM superfamily enzyme YgiQ (UPF0313 family)
MTYSDYPKILLVGAFANDLSGETSLDKMYLKKQFVSPPLGLYRMGQMLGSEFDVRVFDPNIENVFEFMEAHASEFDVIGVSLTHPTLENDLSVLWQARAFNPRALLVAGGEEAFFNCEQVFAYSPVEVSVQGEGELPMRAIAGKMAELRGSSRECLLDALKTVPGCIVRTSSGIERGPLNPSLPPDLFAKATVEMPFHEIPYGKYWDFMDSFFDEKNEATFRQTHTIRFFVSNYCPLKCVFCSSTNFLKNPSGGMARITMVEAEHLMGMIERCIEAHPGVRTILFHDDHFTIGAMGRRRVLELSEKIVEAKRSGRLPTHLGFMAQAKITDVDERMLDAMTDAGFYMMSYGIESFAQPVLDEFNKNCTVEQIERGLEWHYQRGLKPFLNIILTSLDCSLEDVWITTWKCYEHVERGADLGMNPYCIAFPGADMLQDSRVQARVHKVPARIWGTDIEFQKTDKILPRNGEVLELLDRMEAQVSQLYSGGKVLSARRSNIILLALFRAFAEMGIRPAQAREGAARMERHVFGRAFSEVTVMEECD